jgi:hypothetical protein
MSGLDSTRVKNFTVSTSDFERNKTNKTYQTVVVLGNKAQGMVLEKRIKVFPQKGIGVNVAMGKANI